VSQDREHYIDLPLDNEEVAALNVQEEDLIKVSIICLIAWAISRVY
jgi:hypothetical protein